MTYFHDDARLPKAPPTRLRRWLRRLVWAVLIVAGLVWISLRALMSLGGNDPQLHRTIETYLGQTTGLTAHIGDFRSARFYPVSGIDIADVSFSPPGGRDPAVIATLGAMKAETDFWDHMIGRAALQTFDLENLDVPPLWLAQVLHLDRLAVEKTGPNGAAALHFNGHYGATPLTGTLAMRWTQRADGRLYFQRPATSPFTMHAGSLDIAGTLRDGPKEGIVIELDHLTYGDLKLSGDFAFVQGLRDSRLSGTAHAAGATADIALTWTAQPGSLTATISMPSFDLAQSGQAAAWRDAAAALFNPGHRLAALQLVTLKIAMTVKSLQNGGHRLGAANGQAVLRSGVLTIGPASFGLAGAASPAKASGPCVDRLLPEDGQAAALAAAAEQASATTMQGSGTINFVTRTTSLAFTGGNRRIALTGPWSALHLKSCPQ